MAAVLQFPLGQTLPAHQPALRPVAMSDANRKAAEERLLLIMPMVNAVMRGASVRSAVAAHYTQNPALYPSDRTLRDWVKAYVDGGLESLAPERDGRVRQAKGWEARAKFHYGENANKPSYGTVAGWLQDEGFGQGIAYRTFVKQVERYLKSLPSDQAETSRKRVGQHWYNQNIKPHVRRDVTVLNVGDCYEGDGHCCDVYVQHPVTASHFRPELTVWLDVRSTYVPGWWLGERENSIDVLFALSAAIRAHDHVPVMVHTDPGSGYTAKILADEALGFYNRLSISHVKALPGNAKGKGLVEGWFRWFEERLGKRFATFCGHCRTDDGLSRLRDKIKAGEITPPSFFEYRDAVAAYIHRYNNTPKESLGGRTPAQVWAELQRNPAHCHEAALLRPRRKATVRRWEVRIFNRFYRAQELAHYERREVTVEYDLHDDSQVWIRDQRGRLVCAAQLTGKTAAAQENVLADRRQKSLEGQQQRLENQLAEHQARARLPVSGASMMAALGREETATAPAPSLVLAEGHSLFAPPARAPVPPQEDFSQAELELQRARIEADEVSPIPADPIKRFRFWRGLQGRLQAGEELEHQLAAWAAEYAQLDECQGFCRAFDSID